MNICKLIIAIPLFIVGTACANSYGPFEDGAFPEACKLKTVPHHIVGYDERRNCQFMMAQSTDKEIQFFIERPDDGYHLKASQNGNMFIKNKQISQSDFSIFEILEYDLNKDNTPDFVFNIPYGGNGLAAYAHQLAFMLSTGDDYKITTIDTFFMGEDYFVIIKGQPCYIQTSVPGVAHCNDGKDHAFWLYNLLTFTSGGEVKVSNEIHPAFPKAIWYSFAENHDETTLITKRQKDVLVKNSHKKLFWTPTPKPSDKTNSPQ